MAKIPSAKEMRSELHRNDIRFSLDRIDVMEKALKGGAMTLDEQHRLLWEFVGAVSYHVEVVRVALDAMDKLAK